MADASIDGGFALMGRDVENQAFDPPLKPAPNPTPLNIKELAGLLEKDSLFERSFAGFEYRPQQVDMLASVSGAFNESYHLMVEAGTGTGKSMLISFRLFIGRYKWAAVVILTNTSICRTS
jgi:hypothetical protein